MGIKFDQKPKWGRSKKAKEEYNKWQKNISDRISRKHRKNAVRISKDQMNPDLIKEYERKINE